MTGAPVKTSVVLGYQVYPLLTEAIEDYCGKTLSELNAQDPREAFRLVWAAVSHLSGMNKVAVGGRTVVEAALDGRQATDLALTRVLERAEPDLDIQPAELEIRVSYTFAQQMIHFKRTWHALTIVVTPPSLA